MSVTLLLDDDLDVFRGDMFCRPHNSSGGQDVQAMVCWMTDSRPLAARSRLIVKHTTRTVKAIVRGGRRGDTLHRDEQAGQLGLTNIGRVTLSAPCEPYARNRTHWRAIRHQATNAAVGAAMITQAG